MKILVINTSLRPNSPVKMFPVGLAYVMTAMNKAGYSFDYLDIDCHRPSAEEIERAIQKDAYDVICFGCIVTGYKLVKDMTALLRRHHPRAWIIAGNTVASSIPQLLLERTEVDIAVLGEGDVTIVETLDAIRTKASLASVAGICYQEKGNFKRTPERPVIADLNQLPRVNYDLFDTDTYIRNGQDVQIANGTPPEVEERSMYVNTARGCIGSCTFCYHAFQGKHYRTRSPQAILNEIAWLIDTYRINRVAMSDELTFFNKKQTLAFAEAIIDSGLKFSWGCQCRGNLLDRDDDLYIIEKLKEAGCVSAFYSLESADPEILRQMHKNITVEQFSKQTELFHRAGLPVNTSLVFGYPQETPETIAKTFDVCIANGIYPSIGFLLPQPGSDMYDYALGQGLIPDEEDYLCTIGDRQDLYLNLTGMADEDFTGAVLEGAKKCNRELKMGLDENALIKTGVYKNKTVK